MKEHSLNTRFLESVNSKNRKITIIKKSLNKEMFRDPLEQKELRGLLYKLLLIPKTGRVGTKDISGQEK
jgi:hypothetical protein